MSKSDLLAPLTALSRTPNRDSWRRTSGSSGIPFNFPRSDAMRRAMDAVMWAAYGWHGIRPGDRYGIMWGRPVAGKARLRKWASDAALSRIRYNAFVVTPQQSAQYHRKLRASGVQWIYGYPSLVTVFAEHCRELGLDGRSLRLRAVILTGEMLSEAQRTLISEFFGTRVVNEYGCTEIGILGLECENGRMHALTGAGLVEVLDEQDMPVDGHPGRVVITDLWPSSFNFDRLAIGDRAIVRTGATCACGRHLPELSSILGRTDSWIVLPSGKRVYDAILAYSMPASVSLFQGRQPTLGELSVQCVAKAGAHVDLVAIKQALVEATDGELAVRVECVESIPPSPSGKLRYFIPLETTA
jgi:phenylacetate-CoA ligase